MSAGERRKRHGQPAPGAFRRSTPKRVGQRRDHRQPQPRARRCAARSEPTSRVGHDHLERARPWVAPRRRCARAVAVRVANDVRARLGDGEPHVLRSPRAGSSSASASAPMTCRTTATLSGRAGSVSRMSAREDVCSPAVSIIDAYPGHRVALTRGAQRVYNPRLDDGDGGQRRAAVRRARDRGRGRARRRRACWSCRASSISPAAPAAQRAVRAGARAAAPRRRARPGRGHVPATRLGAARAAVRRIVAAAAPPTGRALVISLAARDGHRVVRSACSRSRVHFCDLLDWLRPARAGRSSSSPSGAERPRGSAPPAPARRSRGRRAARTPSAGRRCRPMRRAPSSRRGRRRGSAVAARRARARSRRPCSACS